MATAHTESCFVYRYAAGLFGVDRRGMCDCGAEQVDHPEVVPRLRHNGGCGNQNAAHPLGVFIGAAQCSCTGGG